MFVPFSHIKSTLQWDIFDITRFFRANTISKCDWWQNAKAFSTLNFKRANFRDRSVHYSIGLSTSSIGNAFVVWENQDNCGMPLTYRWSLSNWNCERHTHWWITSICVWLCRVESVVFSSISCSFVLWDMGDIVVNVDLSVRQYKLI